MSDSSSRLEQLMKYAISQKDLSVSAVLNTSKIFTPHTKV
ncbi:6267_t:CDS:2 [Funneliformis geosporum]|uniref:6267_t:CDS:1 n=1 Tax=Funneliformis geosporum TaxID=1117311 RepID=A0A9W4WVS2_9GLOM|nr:6267_t:CDS:2 [Funneliformis geosporum]